MLLLEITIQCIATTGHPWNTVIACRKMNSRCSKKREEALNRLKMHISSWSMYSKKNVEFLTRFPENGVRPMLFPLKVDPLNLLEMADLSSLISVCQLWVELALGTTCYLISLLHQNQLRNEEFLMAAAENNLLACIGSLPKNHIIRCESSAVSQMGIYCFQTRNWFPTLGRGTRLQH